MIGVAPNLFPMTCLQEAKLNVIAKTKPSTDLAVVETVSASIIFVPGGVDAILEKIKNEVRSFKPDISTPGGRDAIKSFAYKIARSKTALDDMGKDLVTDLKKQTGAIDADRKRIRDELDALKDEFRKPLTDWESADARRIAAHEAELASIEQIGIFLEPDPASNDIQARIDSLGNLPARDWQEFKQRAVDLLGAVASRLHGMHAAATKREAERAELERLRREQAEREQRERDEKIAAEAAERARLAAEVKARQEAEEAAIRAAAEQRRVEQEKAEALARAEKAEADTKAAAAKAERDRIAAAEAAEREREAAIEAERKRVADAKAKEAAETEKREANKKHRAKINNEALSGLVAAGLSEEAGKAAVGAIAKGEIPHVRISY